MATSNIENSQTQLDWMNALKQSNFFQSCHSKDQSHTDFKNFFCIDCCESLCVSCIKSFHSTLGHQILQIKRSSYKEAVEVADISKLVDLSDIQPYVINKSKIVFIRSQFPSNSRYNLRWLSSCEVCQRLLMESKRFCSLECKMEACIYDETVNLKPKFGNDRKTGKEQKRKLDFDTNGKARNENNEEIQPTNPPMVGERFFDFNVPKKQRSTPNRIAKKFRNRRKGIPRRAAF